MTMAGQTRRERAPRVRVTTWNLGGAVGRRVRRQGELIRDIGGIDLVFLQEANERALEEFVDAAGLDWGCSVRRLFPELLLVTAKNGRNRRRAVAIAGRGPELRSPTPFPDLPLPEKVLAGWVDVAGHPVTVVTYHAPPGVTYKLRKPAQAVQVAHWLGRVRGPALLGGDFNTPKVDHPDRELMETWHPTGRPDLEGRPGDDVLVGPIEVHPLRDVYRTWLALNPRRLAEIRSMNPTGPLAVSHRTGPTRKPLRYDAIYASPHFDVKAVEYDYDRACDAGADHALVVADLELARPLDAPLPSA